MAVGKPAFLTNFDAQLIDFIEPKIGKLRFSDSHLAAAMHFHAEIGGRGVNTKDADIVIRPAGALAESKAIAEQLLEAGWRRHTACYPATSAEPTDELRAIRLWPPDSTDFFFELLALPAQDQRAAKTWLPVELHDGWYGLPSFRFLGLTNVGAMKSAQGIGYAAPAMMALSNLLSHPRVGPDLMSEPIGGRQLRRSSKDLGRVLTLAWLSGREETETWPEPWAKALVERFPEEAQILAERAGNGLREVLDDPSALEEAHHAATIGLLAGKGLTANSLRVVGLQLIADALKPLVIGLGSR